MSRTRKDSSQCGEGEVAGGSSSSSHPAVSSGYLDHDIAHLTRLRSGPHELLGRSFSGKRKLPVSTFKMLAGREANYTGRGRFSLGDSCHVLSRYLPVYGPFQVDGMKSRAYVSQFSADGSLFVAGFQGSHIRVYNVDNGWNIQKDIIAKSLRWTITDTCLSPDRRFLVYSSLSPIVHIVDIGSATTESVANITEIHDSLNFSPYPIEEEEEDDFGIFSVKFSNDGRELVAATNDDGIYVYDLIENRCTLRIQAHESDVNTVCFADESGHLMYSGSDDDLCKVWDRRCFNINGKAAGVLTGHLEGITFIDSHGDGRYFISNAKDQTTKLWDIRKMASAARGSARIRSRDWDYRWMDYPAHAKRRKHPHDQSLATYKGHSVLRTLIRCYFSPSYSTGQKFIYTGSTDGSVYIYDLASGAQVARLEGHENLVRDCSWHPYYPMIVSSSWDGCVARWEFPGADFP